MATRAQFEAHVMQHLDAAYNLARWLARNDADAQDVTQEAVLRAFRYFDGFRGGDARAWLLTIVRNTFYSQHASSASAATESYDEALHARADPWFDGRLDFSPQVKNLDAQGFVLIGGRLDVLGDERVAALVYKRHLHMINLFQWPASDASAPPEPREQARNGYHAIGWREGGMQFLAVSDTADLEAFVGAFRASGMSGSEPR